MVRSVVCPYCNSKRGHGSLRPGTWAYHFDANWNLKSVLGDVIMRVRTVVQYKYVHRQWHLVVQPGLGVKLKLRLKFGRNTRVKRGPVLDGWLAPTARVAGSNYYMGG